MVLIRHIGALSALVLASLATAQEYPSDEGWNSSSPTPYPASYPHHDCPPETITKIKTKTETETETCYETITKTKTKTKTETETETCYETITVM